MHLTPPFGYRSPSSFCHEHHVAAEVLRPLITAATLIDSFMSHDFGATVAQWFDLRVVLQSGDQQFDPRLLWTISMCSWRGINPKLLP